MFLGRFKKKIYGIFNFNLLFFKTFSYQEHEEDWDVSTHWYQWLGELLSLYIHFHLKKNKNKTLWLTLWIISWNGKFYPSLSWPITGKIQRRCQKPIWARSPKKLFSQWMIKRRVKEKIAFYMEVKMIKKNKNCIFYHQVLTIAFTESFWLLNNVLLHCWESSTTTFDFIK